jgi:hypothetical protein
VGPHHVKPLPLPLPPAQAASRDGGATWVLDWSMDRSMDWARVA